MGPRKPPPGISYFIQGGMRIPQVTIIGCKYPSLARPWYPGILGNGHRMCDWWFLLAGVTAKVIVRVRLGLGF